MQRYGLRSDASPHQNYFERTANTGSGDYDFYAFVEDTEKIARFADKDVVTAYCGPPAISFWSTKALDNTNGWEVQISDRQTTNLGFSYMILQTPHLAIRLVKEPTLRSTPYAGMMLMPDLDYVGTAQYAPDTYHTNIKTDNNPDIQKDEITSWKGLRLRLLERHHIIHFTDL